MNICRKKSFYEIKRIVTRETFLIYLDFNNHFDIHTNDIEFHIGAVIIKTVNSIAFYSRKLTKPQQRYTLT